MIKADKMGAFCKALVFILYFFWPQLANAEVYYLRDLVIARPGSAGELFINHVDAEILSALQSSGVLGKVPAIIPVSEIRRYLPQAAVLVGNPVRYIPEGIIPPASISEVDRLLQNMLQSGNGQTVVVRVPNWQAMISSSVTRDDDRQQKSQNVTLQNIQSPIARINSSEHQIQVRAGDQLTVRVTGRNIQIQLQGRAQRGGQIGEHIPVVLSSTRKTVQGRISGAGEVSVEL